MDLFAMPIWLYIPYRWLIWCCRHWYIVAIIAAWLILGWKTSITILLFFPALLFLYLWAFNHHHHFMAIFRATRLLIITRMKWKRACERAEINDERKVPRLFGVLHHHPPRIMNERGTALEFVIDLQRVGMTIEHLEESKDYICATLRARRARVVRITPGIGRFLIEWERHIGRSIVSKSANDVILPRVELDRDVFVELETSILVVGLSGTGKSNLTWFILNKLNELSIAYRLYVIDPKKVELAELMDSPSIVAYADDISEIDGVIETFYDEMMSTFERMKPLHLRRAPIGPDWPLHLLIIDEILLCDQARKGVDTHLAKVMTAGRAAGFIVIADSQLGQVDALSRLRDLFPQRICMKVASKELTNAVLGPNCEERGARCTEISEVGVGYIWTDFAGAFMRFGLPYIQGVEKVARGEVWTSPRATRRRRTCYTYKLYNRHGILLYVGKAFNPNERIKQHQEDKPWYVEIDFGRTVIKKYPTEDAAFEAETDDIDNLHPIYNLVGNGRNQKSA
jgi:hypothetical protein